MGELLVVFWVQPLESRQPVLTNADRPNVENAILSGYGVQLGGSHHSKSAIATTTALHGR